MSQLADFTGFCAARNGRTFPSYRALHEFSVEHLAEFWGLFLAWSGLRTSGSPVPVLTGEGVEDAVFFPALELSFVENLLDGPGLDPDACAVVALDEGGGRRALTRRELADQVRRVAAGLAARGLRPGDRVGALVRNGLEAIIACLAATGLGAIWSAPPADLAAPALVDRLGPLAPRFLFHDERQEVHGAARDLSAKARAVAEALPGLELLPTSSLADLAAAAPLERWPRFPFNHPLYLLFSSGTTGPPKGIVHGAGGTLLEHVKEHRLHGDLGPRDRMLFTTSTGWMMWNWQLSALAAGARVIAYDGSATFPEQDSLWRRVADEGVTVFGTSPAYLQLCRDAGLVPRERVDLGALRAILSTGSVLAESLFGWVAEHVKDVPLQSISGGTDIIGCFALGHPDLPVQPGELQCLGLGFDVRALGAGPDGIGELVCARPFPSRPLGFWGDDGRRRFHEAYFGQNPGVWTHGDHVQLTPSGGARILGRSDGVLNIRGIRIGPAEIYRALEAVPEVSEAMALEQAAPAEPGGSRLVLLVVLRGPDPLDRALTLRIKKEISQRCSGNHVPHIIAQVSALPTTYSGKRSERAARDALHGRPVANVAALRNAATLDEIAAHPALRNS